ncbi:hypothetical protein [Humisphaera borealis]|uniref:Lipoprotein n=1 Tax=Humisphaera borealis TaxID=2807512 RepID=A0A7M2WUN5_9BACT|nr:hypothetical protein [Humisphaera borealis]QOV89237.1 hypothetical protein IPV69_23995 [Humisphaera borealis]
MRQILAVAVLVFGILLSGCDSGATADLKKPADEVRKQAEGMSTADLEKRIGELEKVAEELKKTIGSKEPTEAQMTEISKLMEVTGIYAGELLKKKLK